MPINFQDFCDDWFRCPQPWIAGGCEYATDGKILVRRKTNKPDSVQGFKPPNARDLIKDQLAILEHNKDSTVIPLPEFVSCDLCGGMTFTTQMDECDTCDGSGTDVCSECGHEDECEDCDGAGEYESIDECGPCIGRYTVTIDATHNIAPRYVALLAKHGVKLVRRVTDSSVYFEIDVDGDHADGMLMIRVG